MPSGTYSLTNAKSQIFKAQIANLANSLVRNETANPGTPTSDQNSWERAKQFARKEVKSCCSRANLKRKLPIIGWLREYSFTAFQCDLIAGLTVGLTVIPQGIAYAGVASLPPQYGLYTAFMGCFVYCLLGSTRQINIGPTAIIALLTAQQVKYGGAAYAIILGFISGVLELLFVIFNLGFLIDFISVPVVSGFSSAAALIISATQLKGLFGLKINSENFISIIQNVIMHITETRIYDFAIGITSLIILLLLRKLGTVKWDLNDFENPPSLLTRIGRKAIWLVCTARNALVVVVASIVAYVLLENGIDVLSLTGKIQPGLPDFQPPPFTTTVGNETMNFLHILKDLGGSIILIPLVSILEHMAIAKVFAQGRFVDTKQELLALGVSNVLGSFVSAFPSTGSFSRTALNGSCGVRTPVGGIYTGALVLLALGVLAPSFKFIPKASLSAVIISAVIFMVEYEMVPHLWRTKKAELAIMVLTFLSCLALNAEYGILIGVGLSLLMLLYTAARPRIRIERTTAKRVEFIRIQPDQSLFFPAIEYLRFRVGKATNSNDTIPVIFDGSHLSSTDFTIAQGIKQMLDDFKSRNQKILFTNLKQEIIDMLHEMKIEDIPMLTNLEELEAIVHDPSTKVQVTVINSSWNPTAELDFVDQSADVKVITTPMDDVKVWPLQPAGSVAVTLTTNETNLDREHRLLSTGSSNGSSSGSGGHSNGTANGGDSDLRIGLLADDDTASLESQLTVPSPVKIVPRPQLSTTENPSRRHGGNDTSSSTAPPATHD